jgi:multidrug efflux pump subunit AcrB
MPRRLRSIPDIDRDKAQVLGVKITDISWLQSTLGSFYINDFNVFGRVAGHRRDAISR